jgi:hypothetical protein
MMLSLLALLHDDGMDIIYFWSAIVIVLLPLAVFSGLTYLVVRAYRRERAKLRNAEFGMRN